MEKIVGAWLGLSLLGLLVSIGALWCVANRQQIKSGIILAWQRLKK